MAVNSDHLIALAREEATPKGQGAPQQARLLRSVSTAYYAVFHALCWKCAAVLAPQRVWKARVLIYRALDHKNIRVRCQAISRAPLNKVEREFFALDGDAFSSSLREFCDTIVILQRERHRADYDPTANVSAARALQHIADAEAAIAKLKALEPNESVLFAAYIMHGLRGETT